MSILSLPGGFIAPYLPDFAASAPGFINSVMNDGGDRVAFIFIAPTTGTLDWFEFRQGTNGTSPTNGIRFAIQGLTGNDPDGTDQVWRDVTTGFGAGAWLAPSAVMTNTGAGGGTQLTLTQGSQYAAVMYMPSFSAGNVTMSQLDLQNALFGPTLIQYCDIFATTWTRNFNTGCIALKYSTGYEIIAPNVFPISALNTVTFNSGSTPDEIALRFQLTANAYVGGAVIRADLDAAAEINLYSGTSVIAGPVTLNGGRVNTAGGYAYVPFPSTYLTANTTYRLAIKPTTGSSIAIYNFDVASAGLMAAAPGGAEWYYSARTDAGAWSDTTTKRLWAAILLTGIDSIPAGAEVSYPVMG